MLSMVNECHVDLNKRIAKLYQICQSKSAGLCHGRIGLQGTLDEVRIAYQFLCILFRGSSDLTCLREKLPYSP